VAPSGRPARFAGSLVARVMCRARRASRTVWAMWSVAGMENPAHEEPGGIRSNYNAGTASLLPGGPGLPVGRAAVLASRVRELVSEMTYRSALHQELDKLLRSLSQTVQGWANFFRYGASKASFSAVDYHTWGRLMRWIGASVWPGQTLLIPASPREARNSSWAETGLTRPSASCAVTAHHRRAS
jgi:hypothetical protein